MKSKYFIPAVVLIAVLVVCIVVVVFTIMQGPSTIQKQEVTPPPHQEGGIQIPSSKDGTMLKIATLKQAIALVRALVEVREFDELLIKKGRRAIIDSDGKISGIGSSNDQYWTIHVYENLPDHISTFHWYKVYQGTGVVEKEI